ncbi:DUF6328 family protein [Patulibacter sp.]|uniref:DUF6328 family protein n=1 Tax=Patulibacter sp. TaxID=1912859 RepID=UPI00271B7D2C|nr:DUF6328 family protein [Patulibacter sp.]MDO9407773.1 DUF6328 family protein [Patulibacter sp.]
MTAAQDDVPGDHLARRDGDPPDADAVTEDDHPGRAEHGAHRHPRTGETPSQRHTRQLGELLMETRVSAVGIQVIIGFLFAVPFQADLEGMGRVAYVVSIMSGVLATALLLAPSVLHRALLHRGQAVWIVAVGTRLLLAGAAATSVSLVAAALLVGDRLFDSWLTYLPAGWSAVVLAVFWFMVPVARNARLDRAAD